MNTVQIKINELDSVIKFHKTMIDLATEEKNRLYLFLRKQKENKGLCSVGIALEDQRIELGLTAKDLCIIANISPPAYRAIIKGKCKPRERTLKRIRKALDKAKKYKQPDGGE